MTITSCARSTVPFWLQVARIKALPNRLSDGTPITTIPKPVVREVQVRRRYVTDGAGFVSFQVTRRQVREARREMSFHSQWDS